MIRLNVNNIEYECDYFKELESDELTINEDLKRQPVLFAFYAVLEAKAEAEYRREQAAFAVLEAMLAAEIRLNTEKITEKKLESIILLDERHQKGLASVNKKRETWAILKGIVKSFDGRKSTLIALASNVRKQMDPDIHLNKQKFNN